jgi:hypothetical protein
MSGVTTKPKLPTIRPQGIQDDLWNYIRSFREILNAYEGIVGQERDKIATLDDLYKSGVTPNTTSNMIPYGRLIMPMGEISYFDTTGTTVTISAQSDGSTNMVVVNPTTIFAGHSNEFDSGTSGRLRYIGKATRHFHSACTVSISSTGPNDTYVIGVAKNGTVLSATKVLNKIAATGDIASTALHAFPEMKTGDYLELYVGNLTDTDNLVIKTMTMFAMGM